MLNSKKCSHCNTVKPVSAFSVDLSKKSGYRSQCKQCRRDQYKVVSLDFDNSVVTTTTTTAGNTTFSYNLTHTQKLPYVHSKKIEWGKGRAKLVKPVGGREEVVVGISDIHIPYQDDAAVASALNLIRSIQPDTVILNGDLVDLFEISTHCKSPERWDQLQSDLDQTNAFLESVREAAGDARIFATEGNHENRLRSYLRLNAPKLMSLRSSTLEYQIEYAANDITFVDGEQGFLLRPDFLVQHGNLIRGEAGASAKAHLMKHGISGMSGHTHRLGTYRKAGYVQRSWVEMGGLMRMDADYVEAPNWMQGCVVAQFSNSTSSFVTHEVPMVDGHLRFGLTAY